MKNNLSPVLDEMVALINDDIAVTILTYADMEAVVDHADYDCVLDKPLHFDEMSFGVSDITSIDKSEDDGEYLYTIHNEKNPDVTIYVVL